MNKDTKQPINNVSAFDKDGRIINLSNNKGYLLLNNISNVELFHPDYEKLNLETSKKDTVYLTPLIPSITLSDVIIDVKSHEYIHIYSYFYSYQLINDYPQAFTDGIIVYTINKKNKLVSQEVLKSRSLKNRSVINEFYSKNKGVTFNIGSEPPAFSFKEELIVNNVISVKKNVLNKKAIINQNDNIINLNINYVEKDNPINKSLFGLKSSIISFNISESFSNSNNLNFQNLKSIQKFYNSKISQKKSSYDYKLIQNISVLKIKPSNTKFKDDKSYDDIVLNKYLYLIPENISKIIYENVLN
ncbi:hypothetical protein [Empedobacter sp.]|uniref:hypothetical protein n=1 Tax=Empedobacter sp. TaxID=1927715 RepID=UPI00289D308B|nr:hypothetical protein [Empedobacter sp.]